jgi:hypothetical protein
MSTIYQGIKVVRVLPYKWSTDEAFVTAAIVEKLRG